MKKSIKQVRISLDETGDTILSALALDSAKSKTEVVRDLIEDAGRRRFEEHSRSRITLIGDRVEALHEAVHQLKERTNAVIEIVRGIEKETKKRDDDTMQLVEAAYGIVARMDVALAALLAGVDDPQVRAVYQLALSNPDTNLYSSALRRAEMESKQKP